MNVKKWLDKNTHSLAGKCVAITGSTGGLGRELCIYLAELGAQLILVDRNKARSEHFGEELVRRFGTSVSYVTADLSDMRSVCAAVSELKMRKIDFFIHNAGAYDIPRYKTDLGYDNVFTINFISPYYITKELLPQLREVGGKVVVVGSIAHNYSKHDPKDVDFSTRKRASKVYGNAKRALMFSTAELFDSESGAILSIAHPGITFTGITAHYPKLIFAIIKYPMKLIFMKPKVAALSILRGVFDRTDKDEWIGPRHFNVWGRPAKMRIGTATSEERTAISQSAEKIYADILSLDIEHSI